MTAPPFVRFCLVGVINTSIDAAAYYLLTRQFELSFQTANVAGYLCGLLNSYCMNAIFTFQARETSLTSPSQIARFAAVNLVLLVVNALLFRMALAFAPDLLAKALAIGCGVLIGFFANRHLVYETKLNL